MSKKPFARQYKGNWIVKIENLFEIREGSRYNFTWGWETSIKEAKERIERRINNLPPIF